MTSPIFCAIDTPDLDRAEILAAQIKPYVGGLKLGLEFFLAHGVAGYHRMAQVGLPIFLDLKLHDIPNTVAGAIGSLLPLQPAFMTIHASGGAAMMRAAKGQGGKAKLLAVTVLTSLDGDDLTQVGQGADTTQQVLRLAKLAQDNGMDGVICSPEEIRSLRAALGKDFILMVPGIRPTWAAAQDQKRTMTPREAMQLAATYLVIGRPITGAENPADAARKIAEDI